MKKKILIFIFCLVFVLTLKTYKVSANAFEDSDKGFEECTERGYSTKECMEVCGSRAKSVTFDKMALLEVLADNKVIKLGTNEDLKEDFPSDAYGSSMDDVASLPPSNNTPNTNVYDKNGDMIIDKSDTRKRYIAVVGLIDEYKGMTNIGKKKAEVFARVEDSEMFVWCRSDDPEFDFECDAYNGKGSNVEVYINGINKGYVRDFVLIYDPFGKDGLIDAIMEKIEIVGEENPNVKMCVTQGNDYGDSILDINDADRKKLFQNSAYCIDLGTIPTTVVEEKVKTETPKCYSFLHDPAWLSRVWYRTTVWSDYDMSGSCGFKLNKDWNLDDCKDSALDHVSTVNVNGKKITITNSGYDGVADFTDMTGTKDKQDIECENFKGLHIIYRVIIIAAPLIAAFFISFDLVRTIISGDEKQMSKFRVSLIKRIVALIILILLPVLVRLLVGTFSSKSPKNVNKPSLIKCIVLGTAKNE